MQPYKKVLLIGGTSGIGKALLEQMSEDDNIEQIFATFHRRQPINQSTDTNSKIVWMAMDVTSEPSIKQAMTQISQQTNHIDWVINAVGLLHNETHQPEKAVRQIDSDFFIDNMKVNALPSLLIAKHIKPLLKSKLTTKSKASQPSETDPAIYATISARVGSISDNQLGGWYSYRMSKAALNMGMKTLSIEWRRSLKQVCVAVLQPGTVDTALSKPFQTNVLEDKLFEPSQCAVNLLQVLHGMTAADTGCFKDWAGKSIEW